MNPLPRHAYDWLIQRGISPKVIESRQVAYDDGKDAIVIPVCDSNGVFLFNKYRRNPQRTDKTKYWNDDGAQAALYGAHLINPLHRQIVVICEGELDALLLQSLGLTAVSSTGGAGTFKEEWLEILKPHDIYICYDNDQAGWTGMEKVASLFPAVHLAYIPFLMKEGSDITDYHREKGNVDKFILAAPAVTLYVPTEIPEKKKEMRVHLRQTEDLYTNIKVTERTLTLLRSTGTRFPYVRNKMQAHIDKINKLLRPRKIMTGSEEDIKNARAVPIEEVFTGDVHKRGNKFVAVCPFHSEQTPSFTIFTNTNKWYCFGCGKHGDVLDYIMYRDECTLPEAIKKLLT